MRNNDNVSVGELIRMKALGNKDAELVALLDQVRDSTKRARAALDRMLARREALEGEAARREAEARRRAEQEFAGVDFAAVAATLRLSRATPSPVKKAGR